jgi:hypothetical protein
MKGSTHRIVLHAGSALSATDAIVASVSGSGLVFIQRSTLRLALLDVPNPTRAAIRLSGILVSRLRGLEGVNPEDGFG